MKQKKLEEKIVGPHMDRIFHKNVSSKKVVSLKNKVVNLSIELKINNPRIKNNYQVINYIYENLEKSNDENVFEGDIFPYVWPLFTPIKEGMKSLISNFKLIYHISENGELLVKDVLDSLEKDYNFYSSGEEPLLENIIGLDNKYDIEVVYLNDYKNSSDEKYKKFYNLMEESYKISREKRNSYYKAVVGLIGSLALMSSLYIVNRPNYNTKFKDKNKKIEMVYSPNDSYKNHIIPSMISPIFPIFRLIPSSKYHLSKIIVKEKESKKYSISNLDKVNINEISKINKEYNLNYNLNSFISKEDDIKNNKNFQDDDINYNNISPYKINKKNSENLYKYFRKYLK